MPQYSNTPVAGDPTTATLGTSKNIFGQPVNPNLSQSSIQNVQQNWNNPAAFGATGPNSYNYALNQLGAQQMGGTSYNPNTFNAYMNNVNSSVSTSPYSQYNSSAADANPTLPMVAGIAPGQPGYQDALAAYNRSVPAYQQANIGQSQMYGGAPVASSGSSDPTQWGGYGNPTMGQNSTPAGGGSTNPAPTVPTPQPAQAGGYNSWGNPLEGNPYAYMTGISSNGIQQANIPTDMSQYPQFNTDGSLGGLNNALSGTNAGNLSGLLGYISQLMGQTGYTPANNFYGY